MGFSQAQGWRRRARPYGRTKGSVKVKISSSGNVDRTKPKVPGMQIFVTGSSAGPRRWPPGCCPSPWDTGQPVPEVGLEVHFALGLDQEPEAVAPRISASGASAGPSTVTPGGGSATLAMARAWASAASRSAADTMREARRPKGGRPAMSRTRVSSAIETLRIARNQRGDDRMVRLPCLDQRAARLSRRARPGRSPAGGAGTCAPPPADRRREADIGIQNAHQGQSGKLCPLATSWVPIDDVELASRDGGEFRRAGARCRPGCRWRGRSALVGKGLGRLLGNSLDAGPAGHRRIDAAAGDAGLRACAPHGRNDGTRASGGSGVRQARPSNSGIRSGGRRRGRA